MSEWTADCVMPKTRDKRLLDSEEVDTELKKYVLTSQIVDFLSFRRVTNFSDRNVVLCCCSGFSLSLLTN